MAICGQFRRNSGCYKECPRHESNMRTRFRKPLASSTKALSRRCSPPASHPCYLTTISHAFTQIRDSEGARHREPQPRERSAVLLAFFEVDYWALNWTPFGELLEKGIADRGGASSVEAKIRS